MSALSYIGEMRKRPRQERSRALIDAVLEAAARVLRDRDLDDASTNRIAKLAGVSIGSVYQYFSNKDQLFAKVIERDLAGREEVFRAAIRELGNAPMEDIIDRIASEAVEMIVHDRSLVATLFVHAPRLGRVDAIVRHHDRLARFFKSEIAAHDDPRLREVSEDDLLVLAHAVMGVCRPSRSRRRSTTTYAGRSGDSPVSFAVFSSPESLPLPAPSHYVA